MTEYDMVEVIGKFRTGLCIDTIFTCEIHKCDVS